MIRPRVLGAGQFCSRGERALWYTARFRIVQVGLGRLRFAVHSTHDIT